VREPVAEWRGDLDKASRRKSWDGSFAMSDTSAITSHRPLSLDEFRKQRKPLRNVNKEAAERLSALDKVACWITERVGTMGFFLIIVIWTVIWLGWNLLVSNDLQFDPPMAFVFWLFISNMIQIFLMPLIMVGQNIQGRHSEMHAEHDLEVNVKAEREIEVILEHLEYQNQILIAMVEKLGVNFDATSSQTNPKRRKSPAKDA
jgi:uncharacterized membrane protein